MKRIFFPTIDKLWGIMEIYSDARNFSFLTDHDEVGTIEIDKHDSMMEVISTRRYEARTHPGILVIFFLFLIESK